MYLFSLFLARPVSTCKGKLKRIAAEKTGRKGAAAPAYRMLPVCQTLC